MAEAEHYRSSAGGYLMRAARWLGDAVLPPQCLACAAPIAIHGALCGSCWSRLEPIERPFCPRLGVPLPFDSGRQTLSVEAIADPPPFDRCRAVAAYGEVAGRLVRGLKYADRPDLAVWMAAWMARAGADLWAQANVLVPVPLHRRRLWGRRYNQSALLARAISRQVKLAWTPDALSRRRATPPQVGLSASQRARNVRGAFHVSDTSRSALRDRRVVLVDDVYTTGATAKVATRALLRAGAANVDVVVFARVVPDRN
ncbi:MAG: ComF family protein [Alphaproteobacteria bacterium]